jgi:hypothetical protein
MPNRLNRILLAALLSAGAMTSQVAGAAENCTDLTKLLKPGPFPTTAVESAVVVAADAKTGMPSYCELRVFIGLVRAVHLNAAHPVSIEPSRAGHSIGRCDGDVLVVDTVGFLPGMLANEVPHGPDLHVVERFTLNADGSVLTRGYTATDPDYFVGEYTGTDPTPRSPVPFTADVCDAALNPFRE